MSFRNRKNHKGQDLANTEGTGAHQRLRVTDIRMKWPLCVTKHSHARTWHHGEQLLIDGFRNISLVYEEPCLLKTWNLQIYLFGTAIWIAEPWFVQKITLHYFSRLSWCVLLCLCGFLRMPIFCFVSFAWAHKNEVTSNNIGNDICEGSIVVFRKLFQQLFGDSHSSKLFLLCKEIWYPSGMYPVQLSYWVSIAIRCMPSR